MLVASGGKGRKVGVKGIARNLLGEGVEKENFQKSG